MSEQKNAIMIYPSYMGEINIGDYIQSIAARQFFKHIDLYVNRERLDEIKENKVNLIANAWYMHEPEHWPPSPSLNPLFVAVHINKLASDKLLNSESIEYFKSHEPIGCRDYYTLNNLKNHGVDAYFSGCLTLTLGQTYKRATNISDKIYFTDAFFISKPDMKFKLKCLYNLITKAHIILKVYKQRIKCGISTSIKDTLGFYTDYSTLFTDEVLVKAIYKSQQFKDCFASDEVKFDYADKLLKEYSSAKYVVTSRIHCALPCLAIGTPVIYINNTNLPIEHNCRLDGLLQLFHVINQDKGKLRTDLIEKGKKIGRNFNFTNKDNYKSLANSLIERCKQFTSNL